MYQNKGQFLYKYAGSFLEEATKFRGMLGLAHYKLKQTLKWIAKKYGKTVVDVNESYTSKIMWDGSILINKSIGLTL